MNAIRILVVAIVVLLGLSGCAAPMPYMGSGGYAGSGYNQYSRPVSQPHSAHRQVVYAAYLGPNGRFVVNTRTPLSAYAFNAGAAPGMYPAFQEPDGRWNIAGFTQSNPPILEGGVPSKQALGALSSQYGTASGVAPTLGGGMSPEFAAELLAELERQPNPCTARESTFRTTVGAIIGGLVTAVMARDARWAVAGAAIGAFGGNSSATSRCQAFAEARMALRSTIDAAKPRCRDESHRQQVNGRVQEVLTEDCGETVVRGFKRIGDNQFDTKPHPARMQRPPESELPPK